MDVRFFVIAVVIQRGTGGDLAEVLDKIGKLIRQRFELYGPRPGADRRGPALGDRPPGPAAGPARLPVVSNYNYVGALFTTPAREQDAGRSRRAADSSGRCDQEDRRDQGVNRMIHAGEHWSRSRSFLAITLGVWGCCSADRRPPGRTPRSGSTACSQPVGGGPTRRPLPRQQDQLQAKWPTPPRKLGQSLRPKRRGRAGQGSALKLLNAGFRGEQAVAVYLRHASCSACSSAWPSPGRSSTRSSA